MLLKIFVILTVLAVACTIAPIRIVISCVNGASAARTKFARNVNSLLWTVTARLLCMLTSAAIAAISFVATGVSSLSAQTTEVPFPAKVSIAERRWQLETPAIYSAGGAILARTNVIPVPKIAVALRKTVYPTKKSSSHAANKKNDSKCSKHASREISGRRESSSQRA